MKTKGLFITGTDTGVGKTTTAALIARMLKASGINVGVMKPLQCAGNDAKTLMKAAGIKDDISLVCPYYFKAPVAPGAAAVLEKKKISKHKIMRAYKKLSGRHSFMIVEGAGGLLVPLAKNYLLVDLIKDMGLPLLIVARPNLGTINHTLLTVECAKKRNIKIFGIVINYSKNFKMHPAEKNTPRIIKELSGLPLWKIPNVAHDRAILRDPEE
ncbi:MAG: dethiobiotin synthase [Candidatus Omnitrophota bacterium]